MAERPKTAALTSWLYHPVFAGEWPTKKLYSLAEWFNGMVFRDIDFSPRGRPVIKIAEIKNGITGQTKFTEAQYEQAYFTRSGDLLFSWSGQPETSIDAFWWGGPDGWLNQHVFRVVPDPSECARVFFYYLLKYLKPHFIAIARNKQTTGLGHVTKHDLQSIDVGVPPKPAQHAIAHILGTLDDKIELNRQMNETLESISQAIFKSWFVDFDPVRAKAEGRDTGLPQEIADLFPNRFEDSELGEIPEGWKVQSVGDIIKRLPVSKKYDQKTVRLTGNVPVLDQGKTGLIGYHDDEPGVISSVKEPVAVFANHTCYMRLVHFPFSAIQNVIPFVGKDVDTVWVFYATYGKQSFIEYKGHWPDFVLHEIVVPNVKLTIAFSSIAHPLLAMKWTREGESCTLAILRDTLLPKLISGELRVKDAERFIEEVGV